MIKVRKNELFCFYLIEYIEIVVYNIIIKTVKL